jgi:hypothetical protein
MKSNYILSISLKSLVVLTVGAILFSNWFFIADVILQDAMMGSGLVAFGLSGIATFLLSNKLFKFKRKWILSLILTVISFYFGRALEENNLTYRDSDYYVELQDEQQRMWKEEALLKKKEKATRDIIDSKIYEDNILALINFLESKEKYDYVTSNQVSSEYKLIYPQDRSSIICPIRVKPIGQEPFLRYFALIRISDNSYELYEWHYLDKNDFQNTALGPDLMKQLNTLTKWNFSMKQIDDSNFWNEYVLTKDDNSYKYLERFEIEEKIKN